MSKLLYGGDYNPDQWLDRPDVLEKDIEYMKQAHINVVSLGIFAWAVYEPAEGEYHFEWLEEVINRLYENGISTILATPSGAKPVWMAKKYPEVLRVDANGVRALYGGRHNHCFTSPVYRSKVRDINLQLARRFGHHPAVILWHISNEYNGECHCPLCQQAFRDWLRQEYGDIETINQKWWLTFWSHRYTSFDQIESPQPRGEMDVHGLKLAWKRFVTHQTADFMQAEIQALRDGGAQQPTTTNLMYDFKGLNYGELSKYIDVVSWDAYPEWHRGNYAEVAMDAAMQHDLMRCLKHQPFLLMESCPSGTNWQCVSKLKEPGLLMNASLQAIAHGSNSVQYFQIRQSRGSSEKFHGAVIDQYGRNDTRVFREVQQTGHALLDLQEVYDSHMPACAAVIYDTENQWALEDAQGPRNCGMHYHDAAMKSYHAFKRYGLNVDVIDMEQDLSRYQIVAAPMLYMLRAGMEDKLRQFVQQGGILLTTYWSGIVDRDDLCYLDGAPHGLMDVLGVRHEEIDGLTDQDENEAIPVLGNPLGLNHTYRCQHLCDLVTADRATVLMEYGKGFYAGKPALTCHAYGSGRAYYIAADMEQAFYDDLYQRVLQAGGVKGLLSGIPEGVLVSSRETEQHQYLFIQNYGPASIRMQLPEKAEVLFGGEGGRVEALHTLVARIRKEPS